MNDRNRFGAERFRVWVAVYRDWQPGHDRDIPPRSTALEPAEPGTMTARQARRYVGAFNRTALACRKKIWAVALPVTVSYGGDTQPGAPLTDLSLTTMRGPNQGTRTATDETVS